MCTGVPGRVLSLGADGATAVVDQHGTTRVVSLAVLPPDRPVEPGEWVLIHAGLALERLTHEEAAELADLLEGIRGGRP